MTKPVQLNERGAVALLTSIIISILLTIIVTGLITLMISELRQSEDSEQSIRAYYAAQSGIEDGVQSVIKNLAANKSVDSTGCNAQPLSTNVGWTCQNIQSSGKPEGVLQQPDQATTIDLAGTAQFNELTFSWDTTDLTQIPNAATFFNSFTSNPLPATDSYQGAAVLEATVVKYSTDATGGTNGQTNITPVNVLIAPSRDAANGTGVIGSSNPYYGYCDPSASSYHCTFKLTGLAADSNTNYLIRLRTRYEGTAYQVSASQSGVPVAVKDGAATIDVTAHAGDVYRRVIYKIPYTNSAAAGLDFVLFSDNNICKDYQIVNGIVVNGNYPCSSN